MTEDTAKAPTEEHRFPCDSCGSDFRFDPGQNRLTCDHCGNTQEIEGLSARDAVVREVDYSDGIKGSGDVDMEETRVAACPNCGAEVEFDGALHASECPFCATPVVTDTGTHRHIKPQGILPFELAEGDARKAMTDWLGSLWFAPNGLMEFARKGRKMQGIYAPYWTYDADAKSNYSGERGTVYYVAKTVMRDGKQVQVREQRIRWTPARGRVARFFDDVLVLGSRALPKRFTDALAPWDLSQLEPYTPEIVAGFRAQGYTVQLDEGLSEARVYMDRMIERDVRFDIGGDRQRIHNIQTKVSDVTFKHVLLPVWLAAYKYRGKTYRFVVNGRTGRVQGERPWSAMKIAIAVILGLLVAGAVGYLIAQNQ